MEITGYHGDKAHLSMTTEELGSIVMALQNNPEAVDPSIRDEALTKLTAAIPGIVFAQVRKDRELEEQRAALTLNASEREDREATRRYMQARTIQRYGVPHDPIMHGTPVRPRKTLPTGMKPQSMPDGTTFFVGPKTSNPKVQ